MTFKYRVQILERHLDSFGHVNNAVYLNLYEEARWNFITEGGYGLNRILEEKNGPVILEVNVKYRKEIVNREFITIESQTISKPSRIMTLEQKMIKEDGSVASIAQFTIGFMDLKERKITHPPKDWLKAIGAG